jgi:hypothetical protein
MEEEEETVPTFFLTLFLMDGRDFIPNGAKWGIRSAYSFYPPWARHSLFLNHDDHHPMMSAAPRDSFISQSSQSAQEAAHRR